MVPVMICELWDELDPEEGYEEEEEEEEEEDG
jgi:hypothetical protein